jgi:hypothetical protein
MGVTVDVNSYNTAGSIIGWYAIIIGQVVVLYLYLYFII